MGRRAVLRAGVWTAPLIAAAAAAPSASASAAPAEIEAVYVYQQYPGSVNWTWRAINTSGTDAVLTVVFDTGPFTYSGWLSSGWSRSGTTFQTTSTVADGATTDNCTVVLAAASGTTGVITLTVSAPGIPSASYPFTVTVP